MEFLLTTLIAILPGAIGGYFAYMLSKVRGYNILLFTLLGVFLGPLVPAFLYFMKPKERTDHSWYPEESFFAEPALLRDPYSLNPSYSTPGYLYLDSQSIIWIPKVGDALNWDYAYAINSGKDRTYKSEGLTWLLLPNSKNSSKPYAVSLGSKTPLGRLSMIALQNVLRNGDQDLFNKIMEDVRSRMKWMKGKNEGGNND